MIEDLRELRRNLRDWDADTIWMCLIVLQCAVTIALIALGEI